MHSRLSAIAFAIATFNPFSSTYAYTDLGTTGNHAVARTFAEYKAKPSGCAPVNSGARVIVTGFGLFSGIDFNISGAVVQTLSSPKAWPSEIDLQNEPPVLEKNDLQRGLLTDDDRGGRAVNRELVIDGRTYSACFIVLDVLWDLAGAIVSHEMERFAPDLVLMTGRGSLGAVIEAGALNTAIALGGFRSDGNVADDNLPRSTWILEDTRPDAPKDIAMTWNNRAVADRIVPLITQMGWTVDVPTSARTGNDYICNNVSYVALQAAAGTTLTLAGGELVLRPWIAHAPKVGFMHLPYDATLTPSVISGWGRVFSAVIDEVLKRHP
jgi:pyrrolidone-carboxylate peptidase